MKQITPKYDHRARVYHVDGRVVKRVASRSVFRDDRLDEVAASIECDDYSVTFSFTTHVNGWIYTGEVVSELPDVVVPPYRDSPRRMDGSFRKNHELRHKGR